MKKALMILLLAAAPPAPASAAEDAVKPEASAPETAGAMDESPLQRESLYTVSSDDLDASESLNRVAGRIDLGFSTPGQSYQSADHYRPGPFGREKNDVPS